MNAPAHSLVTAKAGRAIADSRDVAATFGTPHEDVLEAVQMLMDDSPEWGPLHCEETASGYEIDYDGFSVIMGEFAGGNPRKAEEYLTAFSAMEARIKAPQLTEDDPDILFAACLNLGRAIEGRGFSHTNDRENYGRLMELEGLVARAQAGLAKLESLIAQAEANEAQLTARYAINNSTMQ
jgi:hypothetical protein